MPRSEENPTNPVRVAIYTRVSSDEQVKEHYSLDTQRSYCLKKLDETYGENLYIPHFYTDEGIPGRYGLYDPNQPKKKHRPELTRMHNDFRDSELDVICVYRMNRLWRKAASGEFLREQFVPYGLQRLISCTENIDIDTASGRFQLNVTAAMGLFEAEQLGEWVSDALQKRKSEGYTIGKPFGWRMQTDGETEPGGRRGIIVVPEQAEIIRQMAEQYLQGSSLRAVTKWLDTIGADTPRKARKWRMSSVKRILQNPVHAGLVTIQSEDGTVEYIQGKHYEQRIYPPDVFHQLQARIERNHNHGAKTVSTPEYLLGGLITCGHCGRRLNGRYSKRLHARLYRCSTGSQLNEPDCTRNSERADFVENLIIDELKQLAQDADVRNNAQAELEQMLAREQADDQKETKALQKRLDKLWDGYKFWAKEFREERCERDEYDVHVSEFRSAKADVEGRLRELEQRRTSDQARRAVLAQAARVVESFEHAWEGLSMAERRETIQTVVESVSMSRLPDRRTEVKFALRGFPEVVRYIGRGRRRERPPSGIDSLTPVEQACLYLYAQGSDRTTIAKKRSVSWANVNTMLWKARTKLGADTPEEAWKIAGEFIQQNLHWLPLANRKRKRDAQPKGRPLLTKAQREVLSLLADGFKPNDAPGQLGRSANTAYVQLKDCRDRLGVASTQEAIKKAIELGYIAVRP